MIPNSKFSSPRIADLTTIAAIVFLTSLHALAQSPQTDKVTTWQDLGYNQLPEGFSTDEIPLFDGLNKSRGTWSFRGETTDDQTVSPIEGSLFVQGNPQAGMIPMWKMNWGWPANEPEQIVIYNIMASPGKTGFDLMLIRIGPVNPKTTKNSPGIQRTIFKGTWSLKNRTITWTESDLPKQLNGQRVEKDSEKPRQSLEMVVAADGKISIQNSKHVTQGQIVSGKTIKRTGKAPTETVSLTGKHSFKTVAEISDPRIKPCLPPQATEISLLSDRGGHFARYKVSEEDFTKFLDQLWETKKGSSAHQREMMAGEGEPAKLERMASRFKVAGWKPLNNAITYYSPSKRNGAMTTYYFDREAGIAYHDRGYW